MLMEEYLDILTETGIPTGASALKSEVHQKGFYHNTVHIWFYTDSKAILLSQRSAKKTICPLLWDVSVAGHIDAGESITSAALRETEEEIGLHISKEDLHKIGIFPCFQSYDSGLKDNEFHHSFLCKLKVDIDQLQRQEEEVEALKLVSLEEFQGFIDAIDTPNDHLVPSNKAYYQMVLDAIKNIH
ncbi:NUDIX domain-containing protein [Gaetbulibacter aestuarii]